MKTDRLIKKMMSVVPLVALIWAALAAGSPAPAAAATQQYQYANACYDCHGQSPSDPGSPPADIRPIDSAYRNVTTGGFQGSHRTHLAATTDQNVCVKCHGLAGSYVTGHTNGVIDMTANVNNSPKTGGGLYSKATGATFFNWTSNQSNMGTCSNVNCHFESTTPTWSSTPFDNTATTDCNKCHGAPPSGGSAGTAGSHSKHNTYFTGPTQCKKCHTDHLAESNRFQHATSAGKRSIIVMPHDPADVAGGSYSGSGANFLPSQSGSQLFGSCSNLYCHSQAKSSTVFTGNNAAKNPPTWGSSLPADCSGCHGGTVAAGFNAMSSGKHQKHINNPTVVGRLLGCQECHNATTTTGNSITNTADHVNKNVNIKFNNAGGLNLDSYGPTYDGGSTTGADGAAKATGSALGAGCSNIYCHSDGRATAGRTYRTIAWNAAAISCNGCHGTSTTGYPDYVNAGAGNPGANSHATHAGPGYGFNCVKCHSTTTTNGTSVINAGTHLNGTRDVAFDTANPSGSYNGSNQTCSTTYCHSNGNGANVNNPVWGSSMPADCTGCHGNNASSANPMATNRHTQHTNNPGFLGINNNFSCVECHAATVSNDRTILDRTRHNNGFKDFTGARAYKTGYVSGSATSSCTTYCHSSGQATPVYRNMTGSKAWGGSTKLSCKGCHGYGNLTPFGGFSSSIGEPNYASGAAGSATANTHQIHVAQRNITDSRGCADCHRLTIDRGMAGKLKDYSSLHLNGQRNINFVPYAGYSGNYNASTKTCSNTYCHASSSPTWGNNAGITCDFCHKASNLAPAGHQIHWETATVAPAGSYTATPGNITSDNTKYQFVCSTCHSSPAQHAAGPVSSNRAAQVYFGYTTPGRVGSYVDGGSSVGSDGSLKYTNGSNCTTSYCHSNGNGSNGRIAVTWNNTGHTSDKNVRCSTCHNFTQAAATALTLPIAMASGKHTKHITAYSYGCVECHSATVDASFNIVNTTKHVNKTKDIVWGTMNAGGGAYPGSGTACTNIYCHSQGNTASAPYSTPKDPTSLTWGGGSTDTCNSCHAGPPTGPDYSNGSPKANSHAKHVVTMGFTCVTCHNTVVDGSNNITNTSLHVNRSYDVSSTKFTVSNSPNASTPAQCSTISCHGGNNATWGGASPGCENCHLQSAASVKNYNPNDGVMAVINSAQWAATGHGRNSAFASGNPAANFPTNGCYYCHSLSVAHKTTNNLFRFIQANYSTASFGRNAVCLVCHAATGSTGVNPGTGLINATKKVSATHYGTKHGGSNGTGGQFCWDCHDPHGDGNAYMISSQVAKASDRASSLPTTQVTVTFTLSSQPTGTDYAGTPTSICNACHTATNHYAGGSNNDGHNSDTRCTQCHSHSNSFALYAFQPSHNCDSCHGYPPVRRNLVKRTDFGISGQYSSARFEDYSGGGGAHTIGKHIKPTARASEGWANCAVCHSDGNLNPGSDIHNMITPVIPSKIVVNVVDNHKFDYRRTLGTERYTGIFTDKSNGVNTNSSGRCSNVNCHFKPSKKWSIER